MPRNDPEADDTREELAGFVARAEVAPPRVCGVVVDGPGRDGAVESRAEIPHAVGRGERDGVDAEGAVEVDDLETDGENEAAEAAPDLRLPYVCDELVSNCSGRDLIFGVDEQPVPVGLFDHEASAGYEHAGHLVNRGLRPVEVLENAITMHGVERVVRERECRRVAEDRFGRDCLRVRACLRRGDHRLADVDAHGEPARRDQVREVEHDRARPAADVECRTAGTEAEQDEAFPTPGARRRFHLVEIVDECR